MANVDKEIIPAGEYKNRWYYYFYACQKCGASVSEPVCPYCGEETNLYTDKYYKWLKKQHKDAEW